MATLSLYTIVETMGYDPESGVMVEFWPLDDDHLVVRIADESNNTVAYAKYKFT